MHQIPNFHFGKVANCSVIRVFLPRMCGVNLTRAIPSQDFQVIYDECLRPLIQTFLPNMYTHWPASFASAMTLYQDQQGRIHEGSLDIPSELLFRFAPAYLNRFAALKPYFQDAYFVHEFQGWKGATVHNPLDADDREAALAKLTDILQMHLLDESQWHIDIGLEFGAPGHVVTWSDGGHYTLLSHCLPSTPMHQIQHLISKTADIDHMMHLGDLTGFHVSPGAKGRADLVSYVQAYTTEKAVSYQLHNGLFTPVKAKSLFSKQNLNDLLKKIERMSAIIFDCTADGQHHNRTQEGAARVETRVQLSKALTSFTSDPQEIIKDCLVAIPAKYWWLVIFALHHVSHALMVKHFRYFKWYHLAAIHMIITNLHHSKVRDWKSDCAIGLGALAIWLLNGLYHRPEPRFIKLAQEACQHVPVNYDEFDPEQDADDPDAVMPLMYNAGLYFLCDIVVDRSHTYRLPYHKAISDQAVMQGFSMSLEEVRRIIGVANLDMPRHRQNTERTNNRSTQ